MNKGYTPDWPKVSQKIRQEAYHRCTNCRRMNTPNTCYRLEVHHIDGNKRNNAWENLVALCLRCHRAYQNYRLTQTLLLNIAPPKWLRQRAALMRYIKWKEKTERLCHNSKRRLAGGRRARLQKGRTHQTQRRHPKRVGGVTDHQYFARQLTCRANRFSHRTDDP